MKTNCINICFIILLTIGYSTSLKKFLTTEEKRLFSKFSNFQFQRAFGSQMSGLTLQTSEKTNSDLKFGSNNDFFSFVYNGIKNDFELNYLGDNILLFKENSEINISPNTLACSKGMSYNGSFKIRNVNQWSLFKEEDFSTEALDWSNNTVSSCGGVNMMGGYCKFSSGETTKLYSNLPKHSQIRIQANYHFIDAWNGETAYMKVGSDLNNDMNYYWTDKYTAFQNDGGINVCGGKYPEGRFSSPIDVVINHSDDKFYLSFGSNLEQDACEHSFGVSAVKIYVR